MVNCGIIGYTPLNGHPYSFGCIANGFSKEIEIPEYPQIENYLKDNLDFKNGIDSMNFTSVYSQSYETSQSIASIINAKAITSIKEFPKNTDLIFILCDYSRWRTEIIEALIKLNFKLFVDKPLVKNKSDLNIYRSLIESKRLFSSSMFIHDSQFKSLNDKNLKKIIIEYFGKWDNYSSHAIEPIINFLGSNLQIEKSNKYSNAIFVKDRNIDLIFKKSKASKPKFEYDFHYKNGSRTIVKIKSNFDSFRLGLINLKNIIESDIEYRDYDSYLTTLKIYQFINNE